MSEPQNGSASVGLTLQVRSVTEETIDRLSRQIEEGYDVDVLRRRNGLAADGLDHGLRPTWSRCDWTRSGRRLTRRPRARSGGPRQ